MCGRYATTRSAADLSALFEALDDTGGALAADYNAAPTDPVPIVRLSRGDRAGQPQPAAEPAAARRVVSVARWGLVPPWAADPRIGTRMINARSETVASSRAFAPSFARRRCLVPADGWYEWVRPPGARRGGGQPYFMTPVDGRVLAFAGLWSVWGRPEPMITSSVITTAAVGPFAEVHDRMPLLLPEDRWAEWLDPEVDGTALLAAPDDNYLDHIEIRPVGTAVGNVRNNGAELVQRVAPGSGSGPVGPAAQPELF
ncbi:putative SOS response-associated peptidase YedK [Micromonospora sp. Llam0]|uniref:SOS response-associated peptidase n=1 Tax=Micromonospora sp. Llam0 TaxID=2485143 RepID=UPI000F49261E|nr:SOS response-associated peptidase [Micromonospora sp. Llam0]ROO50711.1 putative SOS response-associated peptidase YedK [Micromonospora sp. Llam0]